MNIAHLLVVGMGGAAAGIESLPNLKESLARWFVGAVNVKILHPIISYCWNFDSRHINARYASKATIQRQRPDSFTIPSAFGRCLPAPTVCIERGADVQNAYILRCVLSNGEQITICEPKGTITFKFPDFMV